MFNPPAGAGAGAAAVLLVKPAAAASAAAVAAAAAKPSDLTPKLNTRLNLALVRVALHSTYEYSGLLEYSWLLERELLLNRTTIQFNIA